MTPPLRPPSSPPFRPQHGPLPGPPHVPPVVLLAVTLLLGLASANAAELYRWTEADGSITFSPRQPPAGIEFERVGVSAPTAPTESSPGTPPDQRDAAPRADALSTDAQPADAPAATAPIVVAPSVTTRSEATPSGAARDAATAAEQAAIRRARAGTRHAPPPLAAAREETRGGGRDGGEARGAGPDDGRGNRIDRSGITASNTRRGHCIELEKRVISLERRLRTKLSAREMDDTVMHMARYQQNVDRHCTR